MTTERSAQHFLGIALTAASAVAYSTAGFFTHLIALDPWTILFWRGIFAGVFIAGFILWQNRGATLEAVRAIGWPGICRQLVVPGALVLVLPPRADYRALPLGGFDGGAFGAGGERHFEWSRAGDARACGTALAAAGFARRCEIAETRHGTWRAALTAVNGRTSFLTIRAAC